MLHFGNRLLLWPYCLVITHVSLDRLYDIDNYGCTVIGLYQMIYGTKLLSYTSTVLIMRHLKTEDWITPKHKEGIQNVFSVTHQPAHEDRELEVRDYRGMEAGGLPVQRGPKDCFDFSSLTNWGILWLLQLRDGRCQFEDMEPQPFDQNGLWGVSLTRQIRPDHNYKRNARDRK